MDLGVVRRPSGTAALGPITKPASGRQRGGAGRTSPNSSSTFSRSAVTCSMLPTSTFMLITSPPPWSALTVLTASDSAPSLTSVMKTPMPCWAYRVAAASPIPELRTSARPARMLGGAGEDDVRGAGDDRHGPGVDNGRLVACHDRSQHTARGEFWVIVYRGGGRCLDRALPGRQGGQAV